VSGCRRGSSGRRKGGGKGKKGRKKNLPSTPRDGCPSPRGGVRGGGKGFFLAVGKAEYGVAGRGKIKRRDQAEVLASGMFLRQLAVIAGKGERGGGKGERRNVVRFFLMRQLFAGLTEWAARVEKGEKKREKGVGNSPVQTVRHFFSPVPNKRE